MSSSLASPPWAAAEHWATGPFPMTVTAARLEPAASKATAIPKAIRAIASSPQRRRFPCERRSPRRLHRCSRMADLWPRLGKPQGVGALVVEVLRIDALIGGDLEE